jgi:hypothetical protein
MFECGKGKSFRRDFEKLDGVYGMVEEKLEKNEKEWDERKIIMDENGDFQRRKVNARGDGWKAKM